jgi:copper chaperone CopZ
MRATNEQKEAVCSKYKEYLEIIDVFGNKVMLQKQLWQYIEKFGIEKHYIDFTKALAELEQYEVIKKEQFMGTSNKVIVFKKYAIRFLTGAKQSKDVGAVPKLQTPERVLISLFKSHFILNKVIPALEKKQIKPGIPEIFNYMENNLNSILYNKTKGLDYLSTFKSKLGSILTKEYDKSFEKMNELEMIRSEARKKGSMTKKGKGKGKLEANTKNALEAVNTALKALEGTISIKVSPKEKKLNEYNIDSMLNAFIYIAQIVKKSDVVTITLLHFDIFNKQDLYHIALCISAISNMFKRWFNNTLIVKLKYSVVLYDQVAQDNLQKEAKKKGSINPRTKELSSEERLTELFKLNNIIEDERENIEVFFTNYNITDNYLDAVKYRNIEKAGGRPKGAKNKPKTQN